MSKPQTSAQGSSETRDPPVARRPYRSPRLLRHGSVRELTQGADDGPGDLGNGPSGT
ncbi:MAG: lasso RiPP family leader peptide-containing protein [Proteobacteria bacterium]|nr:lasso RiPP family leader peptide-containing protein [Pseudomonadota bacterium]